MDFIGFLYGLTRALVPWPVRWRLCTSFLHCEIACLAVSSLGCQFLLLVASFFSFFWSFLAVTTVTGMSSPGPSPLVGSPLCLCFVRCRKAFQGNRKNPDYQNNEIEKDYETPGVTPKTLALQITSLPKRHIVEKTADTAFHTKNQRFAL